MIVDKRPTADTSMPSPAQTGWLFTDKAPDWGAGVDEGMSGEVVVMVVTREVVNVDEPDVIVVGTKVVMVVSTPEVEAEGALTATLEAEAPWLVAAVLALMPDAGTEDEISDDEEVVEDFASVVVKD